MGHWDKILHWGNIKLNSHLNRVNISNKENTKKSTKKYHPDLVMTLKAKIAKNKKLKPFAKLNTSPKIMVKPSSTSCSKTPKSLKTSA